MSYEMKAAAASALGARTARACESCLKVRARWYCAADDAFLCHSCDNMVHSANQLASRHERVKLQTASSKVNHPLNPHHNNNNNNNKVSWHSGFTRKARTPRHNNNNNNNKRLLVQQQQQQQQQRQQQKTFQEEEEVFFDNTISLLPLVPELGSEEPLLNDETEEQLLCRVPVFDVELCGIYNEVKGEEEEAFDLDNFPSDMDLAEFAADVENLLDGKEEEDDDEIDAYVNGVGAKDAMVKVKDEEELVDACNLESILDINSSVAFNNWDIVESESSPAQECKVGNIKKDMFLRLNYEDVITAWASQGSPWTTGTPPNFDDCWPHFLVTSFNIFCLCSNVMCVWLNLFYDNILFQLFEPFLWAIFVIMKLFLVVRE